MGGRTATAAPKVLQLSPPVTGGETPSHFYIPFAGTTRNNASGYETYYSISGTLLSRNVKSPLDLHASAPPLHTGHWTARKPFYTILGPLPGNLIGVPINSIADDPSRSNSPKSTNAILSSF